MSEAVTLSAALNGFFMNSHLTNFSELAADKSFWPIMPRKHQVQESWTPRFTVIEATASSVILQHADRLLSGNPNQSVGVRFGPKAILNVCFWVS
jgi:hypothetical protein